MRGAGAARKPFLSVWAVAVGLLAIDARADGGPPADAAPDSAGLSCTDSGDCAAPTPHCHPVLHTCVECLSDRNCDLGRCDLPTGTCATCFADADCPSKTPYCDVARDTCVECITNENCRTLGVACVDGTCGACGDGVCSAREGIWTTVGYFYPGEPPESDRIDCFEDCGSFCPTRDLGSALGRELATVDASSQRNLYDTGCGEENRDGPDASFLWTAPRAGTFWFDAIGSTQPVILLSFFQGCGGYSNGCTSGVEIYQAGYTADAGEQILIVLDTDDEPTGTFVISVSTKKWYPVPLTAAAPRRAAWIRQSPCASTTRDLAARQFARTATSARANIVLSTTMTAR